MKRPKRVLVLTHPHYRPDVLRFRPGTERDVFTTLKRAGYAVEVASALSDLRAFDRQLTEARPDVVFNLLEEFRGEGVYDFHLVSYLESVGIPCTGCNPRGLILSRNKLLVSAVAASVGVRAPASAAGGAPGYPAFVKFNREHASRGITRANVVTSPAQLKRAARRMRGGYDGELVVQSFVAGAEVSVTVLGNARPIAFAPWRLHLPVDRVATEKLKFDAAYRRRAGVRAGKYADAVRGAYLKRASAKLFRTLDLSGYARFDYRCPDEGDPVLIDVNANPNLARTEDVAASTRAAGLAYADVLDRIVTLATGYRPRR